MMSQADRNSAATLADVIDRILDKGLVINADIAVSVVGVELLTIRIRAALASFQTAAEYGLEFPAGTRLPQAAGEARGFLSPDNGNGLRRPGGNHSRVGFHNLNTPVGTHRPPQAKEE